MLTVIVNPGIRSYEWAWSEKEGRYATHHTATWRSDWATSSCAPAIQSETKGWTSRKSCTWHRKPRPRTSHQINSLRASRLKKRAYSVWLMAESIPWNKHRIAVVRAISHSPLALPPLKDGIECRHFRHFTRREGMHSVNLTLAGTKKRKPIRWKQ